MRHRTIPLTILFAALVAWGLPALAADDEPGEDVTFEALDTNADGYISAEEASASADLSGNWSEADSDGDGKLDSSEFAAFEGRGRFTPPEESEIPEPGAAPYGD